MQSIVDIKLKELKKWFNIRDNVMVAYSGGVDSSLLAQIAYLTLGSKAIAITSDSPSIARKDLADAKELARSIGIRHIIINTFEIDNPDFLSDGSTFSVLNIESKDSTSLQLHALKIYKSLLRFHSTDASPYAFVDVDIERLQFVSQNTTLDNKEALLLSLVANLCLTDTSLKNSTIGQLILDREKLCSTALDNSVAIPHARIPGISKTYACIGICNEGIDFGSIDQLKSRIFILILQPEHSGNFHLEILKSVANIFGKKNLVNEILNNGNKHEICELIKSNE